MLLMEGRTKTCFCFFQERRTGAPTVAVGKGIKQQARSLTVGELVPHLG